MIKETKSENELQREQVVKFTYPTAQPGNLGNLGSAARFAVNVNLRRNAKRWCRGQVELR